MFYNWLCDRIRIYIKLIKGYFNIYDFKDYKSDERISFRV